MHKSSNNRLENKAQDKTKTMMDINHNNKNNSNNSKNNINKDK
jgi:hypothetical protein